MWCAIIRLNIKLIAKNFKQKFSIIKNYSQLKTKKICYLQMHKTLIFFLVTNCYILFLLQLLIYVNI